ncbi:transcription factor/nuclear export subunit protein 2-domain-containing protein [Hyaloraphidium curvatum]|nr:transcription factor/nuclear export subunit protein 2-domain-containing protein [Hyaloraphidium curvatum]
MGAAAAADFLKKASLAAGPPPGDGVAPAGDELAITAAADADAFGSFVADLLWVLDAELGDWDKPPKDLARDPARALEQVKKDLPPPRLRLVELVKQIVKNECVSATLLRLRLETELLFFAGLLPTDMGNFARKTIRNNTAQLYKQQKFNLLREESEGWARVIVEVGGNCVNADDLASTYDATPAELEAIMRNRVSTVLRNLRALVGYFDLDPNRVLDVIIDIFIANVRDYYDFFLRLLEESPWGRKTSWKGDASAPVAPVPTDTPMRDEDASDDEGEAGQDDEGPQPIPLLAQILGFQYQYYAARLASSSAPAGWPFTDDLPPRDRHPGEVPTDLQLVAALLIRRGLVRIEDLWVHMGRGIGTGSEDADAADLEAHFKEWQDAQRKKARENRGASALAVTEEGKKPEPPPPKASLPSRPAPRLIDQKANLCCALLAVGAYHQALWILDRLPKLPYVQPEISALLCRAIHVMIEPLYAPLRPLPKVVFTPSSLQISPTIHWRDVDVPRTARRGQRVYRYFYSEWTEGLPSWDRPQALLHGLSGVLRYVTVQGLGSDPRLWAKLVRIAAAHIRTSILPRGPVGSEELLPELRPWLVIVSRYLLPALSTTYANPGLANEMWNLLSQLTWPIRQTLYRDWAKRFDEVPELEYHKEKCTRDTQYFMKRISQETVRQLGRVLGKVVHGNPVIAYPIVLATIEEYSNFIAPIVESSKYVTHFGIDVLSDSLLAKLEGDRDRLKADGVSVEKWFMNIAMFASAALKKHSDRMELSGFLKLVYDRLTEKESVADLTILAEIISKMAGIESIESLSDAQLEALSGGDTLRREGVYGAEINRNTRKSSVKLRDTLVENRLATAMALAIGRERAVVAHSDIAEHLKMISSMYDQCQDSLVQYAEFLAGSLDAAAYGEVMPMPDELVLDYHLEPDVAFHLARPKLNHAIRAADAAKKAQAALANATKPAVAAPEKEKPAEKKEASVENGTDKAGSAMDVDEPAVKVETAPVEQKEADVWHPGLLEIIRRVERILPQPTWKGISPNFYVTFWQLSLYDIHVPKARYQSQIDTERQKMKELDPTDQKSFKSDKAGQEKRRMYERSATLVKTLEQELREQQENHKKVLARLQREKDHWFAADGQRHSATNLLSQHCLVPRGFFSHTDAVYCAKFVFLIHKMGAANFSTIALLDRVSSLLRHAPPFFGNLFNRQSLSDITIFVIGATENEARHYGRWLSEVLHTLHRWYLSRKLFEEEGRGPGEGLPGLVMVSGRRGPDDKTPAPLDYAGFQRIHGKWFDRIQLVSPP